MTAIYTGTVRHRRFTDVEREFTHRLAFAYVDLDDLPRLGVQQRDLLGDAAAVRALAGDRALGPVRVLTQPRTLGVGFNPARFYFCFDESDSRVESVVAEVTNTPWGESHAYVLTRDGDERVLRGSDEKRLHVSPFLDMEQTYAWRTTEPGETLSVHIESRGAADRSFDATLSLERRPASVRNVASLVGGSLRTLALIYAHAARLALRRVPVHPHPREARS